MKCNSSTQESQQMTANEYRQTATYYGGSINDIYPNPMVHSHCTQAIEAGEYALGILCRSEGEADEAFVQRHFQNMWECFVNPESIARQSFSVGAMRWLSDWEQSESMEIDCTGETLVIETAYCECDDRRVHRTHYELTTKEDILYAEDVLEQALCDVDEMGQRSVRPRSSDYWYSCPEHGQEVA